VVDFDPRVSLLTEPGPDPYPISEDGSTGFLRGSFFGAMAVVTVLTYAIAAGSSLGSPPSGSLIRAIDSKVKYRRSVACPLAWARAALDCGDATAGGRVAVRPPSGFDPQNRSDRSQCFGCLLATGGFLVASIV